MSLTLTCPVCGRRDGYEFRYGGEDKGPRPDEAGLTPRQWCDWGPHEPLRGRHPEGMVVPQGRLRGLVYRPS